MKKPIAHHRKFSPYWLGHGEGTCVAWKDDDDQVFFWSKVTCKECLKKRPKSKNSKDEEVKE